MTFNLKRAGACSVFRCTRPAKPTEGPDDPLCGPHLAGQRRREANDKDRRERIARSVVTSRIRDAQNAYIAAWRQQHPDLTYTPATECFLCGRQIQSLMSEVEDGPLDPYGPTRSAVKGHMETHAEDLAHYWTIGKEVPQ
jgi:hypothetical protein